MAYSIVVMSGEGGGCLVTYLMTSPTPPFLPHQKAQYTDLFVPVMGSFSDDILNFSLAASLGQFLRGEVSILVGISLCLFNFA